MSSGKGVSDEHLPAKRNARGKVLERHGVATGVVIAGHQVGILAKDRETMAAVLEALNVTCDPGNVQPAAWMRSE